MTAAINAYTASVHYSKCSYSLSGYYEKSGGVSLMCNKEELFLRATSKSFGAKDMTSSRLRYAMIAEARASRVRNESKKQM